MTTAAEAGVIFPPEDSPMASPVSSTTSATLRPVWVMAGMLPSRSGRAAPHGHSPRFWSRPPSLPDIQIYLFERARNFARNRDKH